MSAESGLNLGRKLAAAMGIDIESRKVASITVVANCHEAARVEIVEFVDEGQAAGLAQVVNRYKLVEED